MNSKIITFLFFFCLFLQASFAQSVNWAEDVACIVYSHCSSCHNSEGVAPFNLMSYDDAYTYRYSIKAAVTSKSMPPWPPNQDYNPMAHANVLSQDEIDLISNWVDIGAPEGDPMIAPEPPVITTNITITEPDAILEGPNFTVPPITSDLYKCFVIPTNFGEDKYVTGIEIIPGNENIVHHVVAYHDQSTTVINLDNADPTEGYSCFGDIGSFSAKLLAAWAPGAKPQIMPEGMGTLLPDGANIVVQMHYPNGTTGESDQTKIHIKFAESGTTPRPILNEFALNHIIGINEPLVIPPNEIRTFYNEFTFTEPVSLLSIFPHAHLICTYLRCEAELPDGTIIPIIEIPRWDFNWQGFYSMKQPIILPEGTTIRGWGTYDNTSANPNNPSNPPQEVLAGDDTNNEMLVFVMSWVNYEPGDENIVIDDEDHSEHHDDCTTLNTGLFDVHDAIDINVYPNLLGGQNEVLHIDTEDFNDIYLVQIIDVAGNLVLSKECSGDCDISIGKELSNGMYFSRISDASGHMIAKPRKLIVMN